MHNAISLADNWSPKILRPNLWLEARRTETLYQTITGTTPSVANSDVVGTWRDLSGRGNHLVGNANDTTRPTLQGTAGNPTVRFDGVNDQLLASGTIGAFASGAASIFVAVKGNSPGTLTRVYSEGINSGGNCFYSLNTDGTTASSAACFVRNDAGAFQLNSSPVATNAYSADAVVSMIDTGSSISLYVDKGAASSASYTRTGVYSMNNSSLGAFSRGSNESNFAGDIYGFVIINGVAIGEAERLRMISYMARLQGRVL